MTIDLLGIGGANVDRIGRTDERHLAGTSNPGQMRESVGGGVFNALRVAALRQVGTLGLVSARSEDSAGGQIERAIQKAGIADLSCTTHHSSTATYTAILDEAGELVTALADMSIYAEALPEHLARPEIAVAIAGANAVLIDANLANTEIQTVSRTARGPVFAIAISASKAGRLLPSASSIGVAFMNHHEARHLTGEDDIQTAAYACVSLLGFRQVVVTRGAQPVLIASGDELWSVAVPVAERVDVTGAGDALCGGTVAALLRNPEMPLHEAVREGIACSTLTLGANGPIADAIGTTAFHKSLATVPAPQRLK